MTAQARDQIAALRRAQEQATALTVSASSPGGLVRVEVGARGDLRSLILDASAYDSAPPEQLAQVIMGLTRDAAAEAGRQAQEIMAPLLPEGLSPDGDINSWLPDASGPAGGAW
jgi:DNA-binding protein YbaB